jgi:hypothetical protein
MKYVDLFFIEYNGDNSNIFRFYLEKDGKIKVKKYKDGVKLSDFLMKGKYIIGKNNKKYEVTDGINFLKNLKYAFSGSRVRATVIKEEK